MSGLRDAAVDAAASVVARIPPQAVGRLPAGQLLLNRALKRHPRSFRAARTSLGFSVDGHTADLIQRYLYVFGIWEPDISCWLTEHVRPGDVVVDIGANIGYFSLLAATHVGPTGRVLAFEPVPTIADMLSENVRRNDLPIEVHRVVVGDTSGTTEIFRSGGTNLGRSGTAGGAGTVSEGTVPVVRAADAIDRDLWARIRFIKVDVEGDERRVLRGLEPVLATLAPGAAVFVEVTPADLEARGETADELMATMHGLGFEAFAVRNSYAPEQYARYSRHHPARLSETPRTQTDVIFVRKSP